MSQESPTVEFLTGCGLPEAQAKKSVDAIAAGRVEPKGKPCSMHYTLKLKEGHKMDDLLDDLDRYGKFAKATPGKLSFFYSVEGDEMLFFDNMEGPSVMVSSQKYMLRLLSRIVSQFFILQTHIFFIYIFHANLINIE